MTDETARFAAAVRRTSPDDRVPTCPDWDADDLLWHLTEVHAFWARILRDHAQTDDDMQAVEGSKPARPGSRDECLALLETETAALAEELANRTDDESAWFWLETDQTVGSTRRMQAHEATMHRIDAELTAGGDVSPVDPDLAADGIAHAIEVMWAWWSTLDGFTFTPSATGQVRLTASDLGRSWLVRPGRWRGVGQSGKEYDEPGALLVEDGPATAEITGTVTELYRWLWSRGDEPESSGSHEALQALRDVRATGMS